ncbi:MAG TPA: MFS transporter [Bacteroidota bacterium]|nr:MFS transporter [Bacteroidota bacterium]
METVTQKLPLKEKIGYGFGDLASCLFWTTVMSQLLFFYTDIFGLSGKVAGVMFFISRILDAVFDVVIGMTADRTKSRWGKFRPYLLFGAVPLAVAAVMAFSTPQFGEGEKIVYAYITFILFMFLYSTINIPYTALLGVISGDPVERTSASSFKFTGAYLGGIIVSATVLPMAAYFGGGDASKGWQMTMAVYGVAAILFFLITFMSTHERIQPIAKEKTPIKSDLKDLSQNFPWMMLFLVTILFILFVCIRLSVTTHYFKYYIGEQASPLLTGISNFFIQYLLNPINAMFGKEQIALLDAGHKFGFEVLTSVFNTLGQAVSLVGVLIVPWFAKKFGRKGSVIILFIASLIFTGSFYFIQPENVLLILVLQFFGSITGGPISALLWVLYADTADYSEWKTGHRATGLVFSASIMSNKLGWAIGSMVAAFILDQTGFVANVIQNEAVKNGLKDMMSIIPVAVGTIALLVLVFFYNLDEKTMTTVKQELDERRKSAEAASVTA